MSGGVMQGMKQKVKDFVLDQWFPRVYGRAAQAPLEKGKVLFVESKETSLPDSFEILHARLSAPILSQLRPNAEKGSNSPSRLPQ